MQLSQSQSLLDQIRTLANEAGKHLARFYQQDVAIQTNRITHLLQRRIYLSVSF